MVEWCKKQGARTTPTVMTVRIADGSTVTLDGEMEIAADLCDKAITITCPILPTLSQPIILGMDTLQAVGASLTMGANSWILQEQVSVINEPEGLARCTEEQERQLQEYLAEEIPKFMALKGTTHLTEHRIRVNTNTPIKQRYTPRNPATQEIINVEVDRILHDEVIEPSSSPWSSPVVIVRKANGKPRFCIDFRRVNNVTEKDAYPLPQVQATLEKLRGARFISTIDLANGYWQVPLEPESRPITAFTVPGRGLYQFRVMPFGLHSAPATFQRLLDTIIGPQLEPKALLRRHYRFGGNIRGTPKESPRSFTTPTTSEPTNKPRQMPLWTHRLKILRTSGKPTVGYIPTPTKYRQYGVLPHQQA